MGQLPAPVPGRDGDPIPGKEMIVAGPDLRAGVVTMPAGSVVPVHQHSAVELFVFLAGRAVVLRGGREVVAGPGDVLVFAPGEPHSVTAPHGQVRFVAIVAPNDEWRGSER